MDTLPGEISTNQPVSLKDDVPDGLHSCPQGMSDAAPFFDLRAASVRVGEFPSFLERFGHSGR